MSMEDGVLETIHENRSSIAEKYDYIVKRPCGCIAACVADLPDDQKFTAAIVHQWIREGRSVDRISLTIARTIPWECAICLRNKGLTKETAPNLRGGGGRRGTN